MVRISSDRADIDVDAVVSYLQNESYWAGHRSREQIERSIAHSLCYSVFNDDQFVGFARVVTDQVTVTYLCDFFILTEHQRKGIGSEALKLMMADERVSGTLWMLFTQTAHELYGRFGFVQDPGMLQRVMFRHRPNS